MRGTASVRNLAGVPEHLRLDGEVQLRVEAQQLLGGRNLVRTERSAVGLARVLLGGRWPADDRVEHDQGRAAGFVLGGIDRGEQAVDVLDVPVRGAPVELLDVPAVGGVAGGGVLAHGDVGVVLDGDVILVIEDD